MCSGGSGRWGVYCLSRITMMPIAWAVYVAITGGRADGHIVIGHAACDHWSQAAWPVSMWPSARPSVIGTYTDQVMGGVIREGQVTIISVAILAQSTMSESHIDDIVAFFGTSPSLLRRFVNDERVSAAHVADLVLKLAGADDETGTIRRRIIKDFSVNLNTMASSRPPRRAATEAMPFAKLRYRKWHGLFCLHRDRW
jgi:hypothetical protein